MGFLRLYKNNVGWLRSFFWSLGLLFIPWVYLARAESIAVFGFPFQVERIESVDQNSLTLTVLGSTRLIKRSDLNDEVVATYLSKSDLFSIVELDAFALFLEEALKRGRQEWVVVGVEKALGSVSVTEKSVLNLIERIGSSAEGVSVLQKVASRISFENPQAKGICALLLVVGKSDLEWMKTKASRLLFRYQATCETYFTSHYIDALRDGNLELGNKVLSIYSAGYGVDGQGFRKILTLSSKVDRMVDTLRAGEVSGTLRALSSISSDPQYKDVADAIASGLVLRFVKLATSERRYEDALELLTIRINSGSESDTTALLIKILTEISADPGSVSYILLPQVQAMLRTYAFKDEEVRRRYQSLLQRNIPELLRDSRFKEASILFDQIRIIRPDPNVDNDGLRQRFIDAFLGVDDVEKAKRVLSEIETGIPNSLRIRVLYNSLRLGTVFLLLLCGLAVLLATALAYRLVNAQLLKLSAEPTQPGTFGGKRPEGSKAEDEPLRKFVSASRAAGVRMPMDAYSDMLSMFGLKEGCTIQEIKVSYRNAVKECHPDLNPNATKAQTAKFIELTKAYERLVTLHSQRTGEK